MQGNFLEGKSVIVTGGGSGIGEAVCLTLAKAGAWVAVVDIRPDKAEATRRQIGAPGGKALARVADVTVRSEVDTVVASVLKEFGKIDILINNAGGAVPKRFIEHSDWEPELGLNLYGPMNFTQAVLGHMISRKGGKIITTVSDAGRIGEPYFAVYSASKAGAIGFSRGLAKEVGKYGITVNCVALGATKTPPTLAALTPEIEARMIKHYPLGRLGDPQDAANAIAFMASPYSEFITGQVLPVNGGYTTTS